MESGYSWEEHGSLDEQNLEGRWHLLVRVEVIDFLQSNLEVPERAFVYREIRRLIKDLPHEEEFTKPIQDSALRELAVEEIVDGMVCSVLYCKFPVERCLTAMHAFFRRRTAAVPAHEVSAAELRLKEFATQNKFCQS